MGGITVMSLLLFERYGRFLNERELLLLLFKNLVWLDVNSITKSDDKNEMLCKADKNY